MKKGNGIADKSVQNSLELGGGDVSSSVPANVATTPELRGMLAPVEDTQNKKSSGLPPILRSLLGQPNTPDFTPGAREEEHKMWLRRQRMAEFRLQEEKASLERKKQELEWRVISLKEELSGLTVTTAGMAREIDSALFMAPVEVGIYDESFFEHLKTVIISIRKKVNKARQWLSVHNARAAKKASKHPFMKQNNKMQVDAFQSGERQASFGN